MFKFIFYRTLNSQSAVSVTVANLCGLLRSRGYDATMTLLEKKDSDIVSKICENKERYPILIYKVNSMDQEKTFPVLSELAKKKMFSKIYLIGPFASLNGERIMKLYHWVDGVILGTGEYHGFGIGKEMERRSGFRQGYICGRWYMEDGPGRLCEKGY